MKASVQLQDQTLEDGEVVTNPKRPRTRLAWVALSDMFVDTRYQRSLNPARVRKLSEEFDLDAVGAFILNERYTGEKALIDGQHRREALRNNSYTEALSIIHTHLSLERESWLFWSCNYGRNPDALTLFRARLQSGDVIVKQIINTVQSVVLPNSDTPLRVILRSEGDMQAGCVYAVGTLEGIAVHGGFSLLTDTLTICVTAWPDDVRALGARILSGMALFLEFIRLKSKFDSKEEAMFLAKIQRTHIDQIYFEAIKYEGTQHKRRGTGIMHVLLDIYNQNKTGIRVVEYTNISAIRRVNQAARMIEVGRSLHADT